MLNTLKKNFNSKQFSLTEEPQIFVTSQWQLRSGPSIWYLFYRLVIATWFVVTWLLSIVIQKNDGYQAKWAIYLTNWGYTSCTFQAILAAFMLSACVLADRSKKHNTLGDKALKIYKLYWASNVTATVLACAISIIYWSFIYNPKKNDFDAMNFFLHGMNSVIMVLDLWMVSHPFRLAHCVFPMTFVSIYTVFTIIYYFAGGTSREGNTYIYPIVNWGKPFGTILVCVAIGVLFAVLQLTFHLIYLGRKRIHKSCGRRNSVELSSTIPQSKNLEGCVNEGAIVNDCV